MRRWERLVSSDVIEEFGHTEVRAKSMVEPAHADVKKLLGPLFQDARIDVKVNRAASASVQKGMEEQAQFSQETRGILDESRFKAFTPESEQVLISELQLLRLLHERDCWERVGDAWKTSLLPVGALIYVKAKNEYLFVLKTNDAAALCWPAEQIAVNMWRKTRNIRTLTWLTIFDFDEVDVLPTDYWSPERGFFEDHDCLLLCQRPHNFLPSPQSSGHSFSSGPHAAQGVFQPRAPCS